MLHSERVDRVGITFITFVIQEAHTLNRFSIGTKIKNLV